MTPRMQIIYMALAVAIIESDLSSSEVALINGLFRYMDEDCECYPSLLTLVKATKMGKGTICKATRSLVAADWLSVRKSDGSGRANNIYQLNMNKLDLPIEEPIEEVAEEVEQPSKEVKSVTVSVEYYDTIH